jgi:hypothetical protein
VVASPVAEIADVHAVGAMDQRRAQKRAEEEVIDPATLTEVDACAHGERHGGLPRTRHWQTLQRVLKRYTPEGAS